MSLSVDFLNRFLAKGTPVIVLIVGIILIAGAGVYLKPKEPAVLHIDSLNHDIPSFPNNITKVIKKQSHLYASIKDPFVLKELEVEPAEALPQLKLTMIIVNNRHKICKLNGRLYQEGEKGPDFLVKSIEEEKVLIERKGKGQWLFLTQNI